jgi:hypothetical protein
MYLAWTIQENEAASAERQLHLPNTPGESS